jgi:hypothetical protein
MAYLDLIDLSLDFYSICLINFIIKSCLVFLNNISELNVTFLINLFIQLNKAKEKSQWPVLHLCEK